MMTAIRYTEWTAYFSVHKEVVCLQVQIEIEDGEVRKAPRHNRSAW